MLGHRSWDGVEGPERWAVEGGVSCGVGGLVGHESRVEAEECMGSGGAEYSMVDNWGYS